MPGVNVYTTPHNFLKAGYPRAPRTFDQIIGIQTDSGERLWSSYISPGDTTSPPKPIDAEEAVLPLNEHQAVKLLQFFKDWFMRDRPATFQINCHWFARWMTDNHTGKVNEAPEMDLLRDGVTVETLAIGQAGILGFRMNGISVAMHSLVGLGIENSQCLQVMAADGYLATADYDTVRDYNAGVIGTNAEFAERTGYGLYAHK